MDARAADTSRGSTSIARAETWTHTHAGTIALNGVASNDETGRRGRDALPLSGLQVRICALSPTCAGFDCSGEVNALVANPASIACAPCTVDACCTEPPTTSAADLEDSRGCTEPDALAHHFLPMRCRPTSDEASVVLAQVKGGVVSHPL